jgi:hypothetical protein
MKNVTIIFKTSHDGGLYYATSEKAANNYAEKNGLGSVFVKQGAPSAEDMTAAKKVAPGVWLAGD